MPSPARTANANAGNLSDLLSSHAESEHIAAIEMGVSGNVRRTSYRELNRACDAVARGLVRRGLEPGDRIAILALNGIAYIELVFGSLRAGCVPVPVNVKLAVESAQFIIRDSGARLAAAHGAFAPLVPQGVDRLDLDEDYEALLDPGSFRSVQPEPRQVSMQPYTSGTTGRPKGVLLTHQGQLWAARALAEHRQIPADERMLVSAPFFHKNAIVAIKTAFHAGSTLVILPRFDAAQTLDAVERERCTSLTGVPTMMHLTIAEMQRRGDVDVSSVRTISMGSAPASPSLLQAIKRNFPGVAIHMNYGTTEGGPISFGWFHPDGLEPPDETIGYPMPDCELRFVGGPHPHEGELWVRNPGVALGYHNLPEQTAEKFTDGWYKTGDILRQDENGWCYFLGRVDDMFVCGGENIHPQEVEIMLERHQDIQQAAVLPFPDEVKGEVPYAFVVPRNGAAMDEAAVKQYALENGPAYAHPRRVLFLDRIPLTGANKIDRPALRSLAHSRLAES